MPTVSIPLRALLLGLTVTAAPASAQPSTSLTVTDDSTLSGLKYVSTIRTGDVDGEEPDTADLLDAVSGDPRALSYLVASAALLTAEDRQTLLAESATRRRLRIESRLLRRELTLLETVGAVPAPLQRFTGPRSVN